MRTKECVIKRCIICGKITKDLERHLVAGKMNICLIFIKTFLVYKGC